MHSTHTHTSLFLTQEKIKRNCACVPVVANSVPIVCACILQKERDLELAARIGQTLLEKNKELAEQNEILEEQVAEANERVSGRGGWLGSKVSVWVGGVDGVKVSGLGEGRDRHGKKLQTNLLI